MNLVDIFNQSKAGTLPSSKAVYVARNPTLPKSSALSEAQLIQSVGMQEVILRDNFLGMDTEDIFLGSTAYLAEGMEICDSFEEFVINISGW